MFDEPDRFDVTGPMPEPLAFGFGAHFCVGAALARQEMLTSFTTILLDGSTTSHLAEPLPTPVHVPSFFLRPMKRLPLTFTARPVRLITPDRATSTGQDGCFSRRGWGGARRAS